LQGAANGPGFWVGARGQSISRGKRAKKNNPCGSAYAGSMEKEKKKKRGCAVAKSTLSLVQDFKPKERSVNQRQNAEDRL